MTRPGGPKYMHAVELAACLALGQRALIVGAPGTGKTRLLGEICEAYAHHMPDAAMYVLVVDQRIEEFIEWRMQLPRAEVHGTSTDDDPEAHVEVGHVFDAACERALAGEDVLIAIDSIAALAYALNVTVPDSDRVLTGGLLATALMETRKRFGTARAYEPSGSLTIIATAAVETGREADDVVFHDLVGTGNMEIRLSMDAKLVQLWPALDFLTSGARHTENIIGEDEAHRRGQLRAEITSHGTTAGLALLLQQLESASSLDELLSHIDV